MTNELDVTKPCKTRDGRYADLLGVLAGNERGYVWRVTGQNGIQTSVQTMKNGRSDEFDSYPSDIINAPQTLEVWLAVFKIESGDLIIGNWSRSIEMPTNVPKPPLVQRYEFIGWQGPVTITGQPPKCDE